MMNEEVRRIMNERFGRDSVVALATTEAGKPSVRYVDAYYENGAFFTITHALSNKIRHIEHDPCVALAGEWFTAHGNAVNLGFIGKAENRPLAGRLKECFKEWLGNGHVDLDDENTVILSIRLTDGVLFSHGARYEIDFS